MRRLRLTYSACRRSGLRLGVDLDRPFAADAALMPVGRGFGRSSSGEPSAIGPPSDPFRFDLVAERLVLLLLATHLGLFSGADEVVRVPDPCAL